MMRISPLRVRALAQRAAPRCAGGRERYSPVIESGVGARSPRACPGRPGARRGRRRRVPGRSTWSASRMASSSCSTTITVLPRSRSCLSVPSRRRLSRWCSPIEGSSRMYMTPVRPGADLACQADALRLPARERLGAAVERQVVQADVAQEAQALAHALDDLAGDFRAPAGQVERSRRTPAPGPRSGARSPAGCARRRTRSAPRGSGACRRSQGRGASPRYRLSSSRTTADSVSR